MEAKTRSVKGRRFRRASGGHLAIITVALQFHFFGDGFRSKLRGKYPELESLRQFVVVLNLILATLATSLVPNYIGPVVPLDPSLTWREGGGGGGMRAACPPHNAAQAYIQTTHSPTPTSTPGEDTPASPSAWTQHGGQQIPVISHRSIGMEGGAWGCFRRWERSSDLTVQLSPASSWVSKLLPRHGLSSSLGVWG